MDKDEKGKTTITKVGMKQETREGFEYELTISFDLNMNNIATASKDRTSMFTSDVGIKIDEGTGKRIMEWNESGLDWESIQKKQIEEEEKKKKAEADAIQKVRDKAYTELMAEMEKIKFIDDLAKFWNTNQDKI